MTRQRSPGIVLALALAGMLSLAGCSSPDVEPTSAARDIAGASAGDAETPRAVPVEVRTVVPRRVVERAVLPGSLAPSRRAVLAAEVDGTVDAVHVDVGDRVARGRELVAIDTEASAQALAEAEAVQRQRQIQRDRADQLFERRAITKQQRLDAITEHQVADARLARARLAVEQSRITAPWSGTVARRAVEVGDYAKAGEAVIELIDQRRLEARAQAPASDVPFLRIGLEATVTIEGHAEAPIAGRVTRLGAELDAASHTLAVTVAIDNAEGRYRAGSLVRIALPRRVYDAALTVPVAALVELESGQALFVVDENEMAERRMVTLGAEVGAEVVVAGGLEAGERVVVAGQRGLGPGQAVQPVDEGGGSGEAP